MVRLLKTQETIYDLHFPKAGIDRSQPFGVQPARPMAMGEYASTCAIGQNVRAYEPGTDRIRGGSRPGLVKYIPVPLVAGWIVQDLDLMVTGGPPPGGNMQTSQSGRVVTVVAVSQGQVYAANAGDTTWTAATNNTGNAVPLNFTGIMFSAPNLQKLWFVDGINFCVYDPHINRLDLWTASAGSLPVDEDGNGPRLICTWRGRTVLSGLLRDPQNWFMSRVDDPTDFDYAPLSPSPTQAVAGNNSTLGQIGDVVTSLVPYNDDILIFGGDHTLWRMQGDPMAGGQIDRISDSIGMAWGMPWAKDPYGTLYFVSNRTGIYSLVPGQAPVRISQPVEQVLADVDTGTNSIRMMWNDRQQGLHVFVTPLEAPAAATHLFWEQRTGGWFTDAFSSNYHNPLCCVVFDGNDPGDRVPLIGSWDGYVRALDNTATDDDGITIFSAVAMGPILTPDLDTMLLKDMQAVLGETSGDVIYGIFAGTTPEAALATITSGNPIKTGTWSAGRNLTNFIRVAAHAIYVKIASTGPWAMESIRTRIATQGKVRRRGR